MLHLGNKSSREIPSLISSGSLCRASWNGFPWPSSCIPALHHQAQCRAWSAVV
ncbi:hypothetical protein NFI96_031701 [Prochilodus magdalenae]|nr:hypothetical protein NFI96_031701 [Prochilodus magdalenae]